MRRPYPRYRDSGAEWLGNIPDHWEIKRLGRFGSFFKGGGGTKEDETDDGVPCVRYGDLYTQHEYLIRHTRAHIAKDATANYRELEYGDVLFAGSGETIDEIGKSAVNLIESPAYCGGDVIVLRPAVKADATYMGYAADCQPSVYQKACMGRGVTVMHIYSRELKQMLIPQPPLDEQRSIAEFLDRETGKVDQLVDKKRFLIERLEEYRQALITRTVTKGLPPDAARAAGLDPSPRLKHSGVKWLGDIPQHWELRRVGTALAETVGGGTPSTENESYWASADEEGLPWVAIADMSAGGEVSTTAKRVTMLGCNAARLRPLAPGTIIYSMYASVGVAARLGICAVTNQAILGFLPGPMLEPSFLYWWLTAIRNPVLALTRNNTQSNLNAETVHKIPLALPPLEEQQAIAAFLDEELERIDALAARVEAAIERLEEYRAALITAAVTGKIDVRGDVPAEPERVGA